MRRLKISPSALKAFQACPRRWFLEFVQRVDRIIPPYVTAGNALDLSVQHYLKGGKGLITSDTSQAELDVLRPELPAPGTVLVQARVREQPVPGPLGARADISTGGLDYLTPPNLDLMVIGDLKRIWHKDAAMSPEQLANDVQAQSYAWLVWQVYNPARIIWRWTYCVRETRNGTTGVVTRKAKAFSVDVEASRERVEAWVERIVLPAAQAMLDIIDAAPQTAQVDHDPTSCEEGARCFVRHHCPLYSGPTKGETHMVDLSRFKTNKTPPLSEAVEAQRARIAINPPAPDAYEERALAAAAIVPPGGPTAEMLASHAAAQSEAAPTEPAPAPEAEAPAQLTRPSPEDKPARRRRAKAEQAPLPQPAADLHSLGIEQATTEQLVDELRDRGWSVWLESRGGL